MAHPYQNLPDYQFHRVAVAGEHPAYFDPLTDTKFRIGAGDGIATMGSCFAQNLSKWLMANGKTFLAVEPSDERVGGLFSANYGNVYTVAQGLQVFNYAFGLETPSEESWVNAEGKFVDPLRSGATSAGFDSAAAMLEARSRHYAAVRAMFTAAPVLVFTLGLTESWIRTSDGAVLPSAPGVVAGTYDADNYEFVNYGFTEVADGLGAFLKAIVGVNPAIKIILTVSPVPLAATYVKRHVAVSTMASKAILRAAVEAVTPRWPNVEYFPSFEIFYTPGIGDAYFEADHRHVNSAGVAHAMRVFERHFLGDAQARPKTAAIDAAAALKAHYDMWCDDDKIG